MKQLKKHRFIQIVAALAIVICLMVTMVMPAGAASQAVQDVANSILRVNVYMDFLDKNHAVASGSCFLISDDIVLTAAHCVRLSPNDIDAVNQLLGYSLSEKDVYENIHYTVSVRGDVEIPATILGTAYSDLADFAVLKLSQSIGSKEGLTLRDSKAVKAAETVYTVGFPAVKEGQKLYTASDVAYEQATITKPEFKEKISIYAPMELFTYVLYNSGRLTQENVDVLAKYYDIRFDGNWFYSKRTYEADVLMHSGYSSQAGNSGGPVVDENGYVVGIVSHGGGADDSAEATAIGQVMEVLDLLNINYNKVGDSSNVDYTALQASITKAEGIKSDEYSAESYKKLSEALTAAKTALNANKQSEVDAAKSNLDKAITNLEAKHLNSWVLIAIIIAVAVIVIGAVVAIILVVFKKKSNKATAVNNAPVISSAGYNPAGTPVAPAAPAVAQQPEGSEGTTVLSSNAPDPFATTVLNSAGPTAYLVRMSNNERINLNKPYFKVGKDASRVDYCIKGNPAISRFHAAFIFKNGQYFVADNSTTNHTYVNDKMLSANVETPITNGAIIILADERFEFKF